MQVFGELGSWSPAGCLITGAPAPCHRPGGLSGQVDRVHGMPPKLYTLGHTLVSSEALKTHVRKRSEGGKPHSGF